MRVGPVNGQCAALQSGLDRFLDFVATTAYTLFRRPAALLPASCAPLMAVYTNGKARI